jgi:AbrB family looped-hinge helix DNA binding protein
MRYCARRAWRGIWARIDSHFGKTHLTDMNMQTKMSGKGQVVIPKDVRDRFHFGPGDALDVVERPDGVLLRKPATKGDASFAEITARIRARIKYDGPPVPVAEMGKAIEQMWAAGGPRWDD